MTLAGIKAGQAFVTVDVTHGPNIRQQARKIVNDLRGVFSFGPRFGSRGGTATRFRSPLAGASRAAGTGLLFGGSSLRTLGGIGAGVGVGLFFKDAIEKSKSFEETLSRFNIVFRDMATETRQWSNDYSDAIGRSATQSLNFLSLFQNFQVGFGKTREEAASLSRQLRALTADLGSFFDVSDQDAYQRLFQGLAGSTEALDIFGINAREQAVKFELAKAGIDFTTASAAQKADARFNIILRASKDAQGDAIRTADSFANSLRGIAASYVDLGTQFGLIFTRSERLAEQEGKRAGLINQSVLNVRKLADGIASYVKDNEDIIRSSIVWVAKLALASATIGGMSVLLKGVLSTTIAIGASIARWALLGPARILGDALRLGSSLATQSVSLVFDVAVGGIKGIGNIASFTASLASITSTLLAAAPIAAAAGIAFVGLLGIISNTVTSLTGATNVSQLFGHLISTSSDKLQNLGRVAGEVVDNIYEYWQGLVESITPAYNYFIEGDIKEAVEFIALEFQIRFIDAIKKIVSYWDGFSADIQRFLRLLPAQIYNIVVHGLQRGFFKSQETRASAAITKVDQANEGIREQSAIIAEAQIALSLLENLRQTNAGDAPRQKKELEQIITAARLELERWESTRDYFSEVAGREGSSVPQIQPPSASEALDELVKGLIARRDQLAANAPNPQDNRDRSPTEFQPIDLRPRNSLLELFRNATGLRGSKFLSSTTFGEIFKEITVEAGKLAKSNTPDEAVSGFSNIVGRFLGGGGLSLALKDFLDPFNKLNAIDAIAGLIGPRQSAEGSLFSATSQTVRGAFFGLNGPTDIAERQRNRMIEELTNVRNELRNRGRLGVI